MSRAEYHKQYYQTHKEDIKRNVRNYQIRHADEIANINIRIKKTDAQRYKEAAKKANSSLRAFILQAIEEKIEKI